jgi:hypothetical protein
MPAKNISGEAGLDPVKRTPDEWRALCFPPKNKRGLQHDFAWQHGAAAALHMWGHHAHHAGAPIQLSGADYYEALVAASTPTKTGDYRPHHGALSPLAPARA